MTDPFFGCLLAAADVLQRQSNGTQRGDKEGRVSFVGGSLWLGPSTRHELKHGWIAPDTDRVSPGRLAFCSLQGCPSLGSARNATRAAYAPIGLVSRPRHARYGYTNRVGVQVGQHKER